MRHGTGQRGCGLVGMKSAGVEDRLTADGFGRRDIVERIADESDVLAFDAEDFEMLVQISRFGRTVVAVPRTIDTGKHLTDVEAADVIEEAVVRIHGKNRLAPAQ